MTSPTLTREQWATVLETADPPTYGEVTTVVEELADHVDDGTTAVDRALAEDTLATTDDGLFPAIYVADDHEEPDSPDANPGGDASKTATQDGRDAFRAAIEFFHSRLDRRIHPDDDRTARDHYRDHRGWTDDTIDEKLLGWAPPSETALLDHLMGEGYDREQILASGLFWDDLSPIWKGRLVLPYLDEVNEPAFAISRSVDHPADTTGYGDGPAKYHKIPGRDGVAVEEPIFGLASIEPGEPVLVTEGIADAITAHQAGYPCVSPVTTTFKKDDREQLADALTDADVPRVYVVQDAERPTTDLRDDADGWDTLTAEQYGEGVRGAVSTAAFLTDHGVDTYLGELPRPGLEKVDLDDYIQDWGSLKPVLASAKPAPEHPAFDPDSNSSSDGDDRTDRSGDTESALFDLDLTDVATVSSSDRTTNPLGHHGNSENYYVVADDGETAFDHKYKTTYNALTHLLVEAGERTADDPKGDFSDVEVFHAWREAKVGTGLASSDPVPYRALRGIAVDDGLLDRDELVERETDTGSTYTGFPNADAYDAALEHVADTYGVDPGREKATRERATTDDSDDYYDDPRDADVVLEPRRAWDAARRVTPDDLSEPLDVPTTDDGDAWTIDGHTVDVVRAVAVSDHDIGVEDPLDGDAYDRAYRRARDVYGTPLPEYVTEADAADRYDVVIGAVRELGFHDLDTETFTADVTETDNAGNVTHYVDPSPVDGWRDSDSGESVLVFDSGNVWDADTEETIDALRLVALDSGLIATPTDDLAGDTFEAAYRRARSEYGAPLPRWAIGEPDTEPVLPPADELVNGLEDPTDPRDELDAARDRVESLYCDLATDTGDAVSVLQVLPSLGKTTSAIKTATDVPTAYLAPRKDLMEQAAEKATEYGATYEHLPVLGGGDIAAAAVDEAVTVARDTGQDILKTPWALLDAVDEELYPEDADDSDDDLDRATCPTAEGEHGDAWALAIHTARALDYTPRDIHERSEALFGRELPCQDGGNCEYSRGWDRVADPDRSLDLVIGSYGHAHVESARTHYDADSRGVTDRSERAIVLDEFPGEAFTEEFGPEFVDHATWLASALRADVDDRQDLFGGGLWSDEWVRAWLRGNGDEHAGAAVEAAERLADVAGAAATARTLLDEYHDLVDDTGLETPLAEFTDAYTSGQLDAEQATRFANRVRGAADTIQNDALAWLSDWVREDVATPLDAYDGADPLAALPEAVSGDLRAFLADATEAAADARDGAESLLRAATTALQGGDDGARELAVYADSPYAHRQAHRLLEGLLAPDGDDAAATIVETPSFAYGDADGARLKHVRVDRGPGATDTVLVDRDHGGATILSPPDRTAGNGETCPVVGLDATARRQLWALMLGTDVELADIHDSRTERARFLRDVLGLQVVQMADRPRPYEGDPGGKDLDSDVALLEEISSEYSGVTLDEDTGRPDTVGSPACITSKVVRDVLEDDSRLEDTVAEWSNYGAVTGDNDLGDHRLAALLGSPHYGDHAIEKLAALGGEEVQRSGHGAALEYGSELADTYLEHMREDQVMQAALRFTRGSSGAVVFARTSALRRDLPVVGQGQVVRSWSDTAHTVAKAWRRTCGRGEQFTVADVANAVDVSNRQVRRVLNEFAAAGYLTKHEDGRANTYTPGETPSTGEVELPGGLNAPTDPDTPRKETYYTGNVRVWNVGDGPDGGERGSQSVLPAPDAARSATLGLPRD